MKIAQIVPSLEARYGGPSRSVYQLSSAMSACGADVDLMTTNPEPAPLRREAALAIHTFKRSFPQSLCFSGELKAHLNKSAYQIVHHHSLWLRTLHYAASHSAPRSKPPLIIAPRGMMSPWAWQHHRWKKNIAQHWIHPGAMENAAGWHVTSSAEADDIRRLGFKQPICIAPNSATPPTQAEINEARIYWEKVCPETKQRRVALFHSRFHRKKRVLELVDLWLRSAPEDWLLLLVGIPEEYSVEDIRHYIQRNSGGGRVQVFSGAERPSPYAVASLFLLPSHSENYGLVIAEALAHGVPVVVTDSTPWLELNNQQCGWCVPWTDYADTVAQALLEDPAQLRQRGVIAAQWILRAHSWAASAKLLMEFYSELQSHAG